MINAIQERAALIARQIQTKIVRSPQLGLVLGSGWGTVAEFLEDSVCVPFASLDGMPHCGVQGHAGNFVFGNLEGCAVMIVQGRFHMYEGWEPGEAILPIAILYELGVSTVVLTNAAGALNESFHIGDLMVLCDHINGTGKNPLVGVHATNEFPVFVDMTSIYDAKLRLVLNDVCDEQGVPHQTGVYMQLLGPSFETPAEIRAFQKFGADAVGMSTAIEAIYARYLKMRVVGLSCITNMGAGLCEKKIEHSDVLSCAQERGKIFAGVLRAFARRLAQGA